MEYLSLKKEGHIGIITLDRPPVNAGTKKPTARF